MGHICPCSLMPPVAEEGSSTPTCSVESDTMLASTLSVLDVAEKAVEELPIYGLKVVISTIRTVLQSVKVRVINCQHFG